MRCGPGTVTRHSTHVTAGRPWQAQGCPNGVSDPHSAREIGLGKRRPCAAAAGSKQQWQWGGVRGALVPGQLTLDEVLYYAFSLVGNQGWLWSRWRSRGDWWWTRAVSHSLNGGQTLGPGSTATVVSLECLLSVGYRASIPTSLLCLLWTIVLVSSFFTLATTARRFDASFV